MSDTLLPSSNGAIGTIGAWIREATTRLRPFYERPRRLYQGQLSGSDALLYTAPVASATGTSPHTRITELIICNTDTSAVTLTLNLVAVGGSSAATNRIYSACSIAANSTMIVPLATVVEAGGMIRGLAGSADKLTLTITGIEMLTIRTT